MRFLVFSRVFLLRDRSFRRQPACQQQACKRISRKYASYLLASLALSVWLGSPSALLAQSAAAPSCTTQSQMNTSQRDSLVAASERVAQALAQGNATLLRELSTPQLAPQIDEAMASLAALSPDLRHATLTVDNLYLLNARNSSAANSTAIFYCGLPGSLLTVALHLPDLPRGSYAVAILHASGVEHPQSLTLVLKQADEPTSATGSAASAATNSATDSSTGSATRPDWLLAGFFPHPLTLASHDGLWYWTQARQYAQQKMQWNAWFYYQAARSLLLPAPFLVSPNLEKLDAEAAAIHPEALKPQISESHPLVLSSAGQSFRITAIGPSDALGPLDLALSYQPSAAQAAQQNNAAGNATGAREQVTELGRALLAAYPQLATAFHGLWIRMGDASGSAQSSGFALELPMSEIRPAAITAASASPAASAAKPARAAALGSSDSLPQKPEKK